jgi:hypothetical protein
MVTGALSRLKGAVRQCDQRSGRVTGNAGDETDTSIGEHANGARPGAACQHALNLALGHEARQQAGLMAGIGEPLASRNLPTVDFGDQEPLTTSKMGADLVPVTGDCYTHDLLTSLIEYM